MYTCICLFFFSSRLFWTVLNFTSICTPLLSLSISLLMRSIFFPGAARFAHYTIELYHRITDTSYACLFYGTCPDNQKLQNTFVFLLRRPPDDLRNLLAFLFLFIFQFVLSFIRILSYFPLDKALASWVNMWTFDMTEMDQLNKHNWNSIWSTVQCNLTATFRWTYWNICGGINLKCTAEEKKSGKNNGIKSNCTYSVFDNLLNKNIREIFILFRNIWIQIQKHPHKCW